MKSPNKVIESSLKAGSDKSVDRSCNAQILLSENNEVVSPNLQRSVATDPQLKSTNFIKPKKILNISTFNIRSGREDWKIQELSQLMDDHNISMIAIQEHRRIHEEKIKYEEINNHVLITSSAVRNSAQAAIGGVGLLLNKKASSALCEVTSISSRIMQATFAGNPELTLISVYAPTNCKGNEESAEEFYSQLRDAIGQTPQHNLLLVLGDFNAKISSAHTRYAHDKRTNENGVRLVDLSCEKSLIITNNNLLKKMGRDGHLKIQRRRGTNWTMC